MTASIIRFVVNNPRIPDEISVEWRPQPTITCSSRLHNEQMNRILTKNVKFAPILVTTGLGKYVYLQIMFLYLLLLTAATNCSV